MSETSTSTTTTTTTCDFWAVNPLEDPIVCSTLREIHMTGMDLMQITAKDLNRRLIGFPKATIGRLKKCRRTLKNRGYAKNCRIKRLCLRNELEKTNRRMVAEINELRRRNRLLALQIKELQGEYKSNFKQEPDSGGCPSQIEAIGCHTHRNEHFNNQQVHPACHEQQLYPYQQQQQTFYEGGGTQSYDQHNASSQCIYLEQCHDDLSDASQISSSSSSMLCNSLDGSSSSRYNLQETYRMVVETAPNMGPNFRQANPTYDYVINDYRFS